MLNPRSLGLAFDLHVHTPGSRCNTGDGDGAEPVWVTDDANAPKENSSRGFNLTGLRR